MSYKCDRCSESVASITKLTHVSYSGSMFSKITSSMDVCHDCYLEMKESDKWSW